MFRSWRRDRSLSAPSFRLNRFRPGLESLENRSLPAVFSPLAATPDGDAGSLRAAILAANGNGQVDTFNLEGATYELSAALVGFDNTGALGDLDLTEAGRTYVFQGAGAGVTIISAHTDLFDRVLHVASGVTVILRDLTITGGHAFDDGIALFTDEARGGGILNWGNLTLERVVVSGNVAGNSGDGSNFDAFGGGIASFGDSNTLTVISSSVASNNAFGSRKIGIGSISRHAFGGGIHASGSDSVRSWPARSGATLPEGVTGQMEVPALLDKGEAGLLAVDCT